MDNEKPHFWIPKENIKSESIPPHGGGKSYQRPDFTRHGKHLQKELGNFIKDINVKKDLTLLDRYILEIETPKDFKIKQAINSFKAIDLEIISYSLNSDNKATAFLSKEKLGELQDRINQYTEQQENPGKSYLSALENIHPVELKEKLDTEVFKPGNFYKCIIGFYDVLNKKEREVSLSRVSDILKERNVKNFQRHTLIDETIFVAATLPYEIIDEIGKDFVSVNSITLDSAAIITESFKGESLPKDIAVTKPETDVIVGVIDSGISKKI